MHKPAAGAVDKRGRRVVTHDILKGGRPGQLLAHRIAGLLESSARLGNHVLAERLGRLAATDGCLDESGASLDEFTVG